MKNKEPKIEARKNINYYIITTDIANIEGSFRYTISKCFCCSKLINVKLVLDENDFTVYYGEDNKNVLIKIPRDCIIAINKRQIDRNDVFKFSVHYQMKNSNNINELKLKTRSREETDRWIYDLRKILKPKRYEFKYNKETQEDATLLFPFHSISDPKLFYVKLCHLEYILGRGKMREFFRFYEDKRNAVQNNKEKIINKNNSSDSILIDKSSGKNTDKKDDKNYQNKNEHSDDKVIDTKDIGIEIK